MVNNHPDGEHWEGDMSHPVLWPSDQTIEASKKPGSHDLYRLFGRESGMKYAVIVPLDQTVGYLTGKGSGVTTDPKEAFLWNSWGEAEVFARLNEGDKFEIEDVPDEAAFRAQGPTW